MSNGNPFRDNQRVQNLCNQINQLATTVARRLRRPIQVMEVCGGHTHAIYKSGIDQLLNQHIEFIHGPGCPVCVLPIHAIDQAINIAQQPNTILASFGDAIRVPGSQLSLQQAKALGADVRVLYSPYDAIDLADANPDKKVVFFAIGFDTTMPSIAHTIIATRHHKLKNLFFLCHHIRLLPTLYALLEQAEVKLDGFIGPGHVSMVIGSDAYHPIAAKYQKPLVIAGFEPVDFLQALLQLLQQLHEGRCAIENAYARVVSTLGNQQAIAAIDEVFKSGLDVQWRGLGKVAKSGVSIRQEFHSLDASQLLPAQVSQTLPEPVYCSEVLRGVRKPTQCPLFKTQCNPQHPVGALMVSSEGACAAYYQYHDQCPTNSATTEIPHV